MAESGRACPYDSANIFSRLTFWWLNPFFALGSKHEITSDNICEVSKHDESKLLETKLERLWKIELQRHAEGGKAKLLLAVFKAFKWQIILPGIILFAVEALKIAQPILIGMLVSYLNGEHDSLSRSGAYIVGIALGLSGLLLVCLNPTAFFILQHVSMRMKVAVGSLIYRKVLTLSAEAFQQTSAGQIVNHLSTDVEKFNDIANTVHYFWISPLSVGVVMYLMYRQVGVACLWGFLVMAIIIPLQGSLANLFGRLRHHIAATADQRLQLMTETVLGMRVMKMHCWEFPFQRIIMKLRRSETSYLRVVDFLTGFLQGLETTLTRIALMAFVLGLLARDGTVHASDAFTCLAFLYVASELILCFPVKTVLQWKDLLTAGHLVQEDLVMAATSFSNSTG